MSDEPNFETVKANIKERLRIMAVLEKEAQELTDWIEETGKELEADPIYQRYEKLVEQRKEVMDKKKNISDGLKELAVLQYFDIGEKKPAPGVEVRIYTRLNYDEETAFSFCEQHLPAALKLDKKKFEKYVKAMEEVDPVDFVEIVEDPRVFISGDFSEYLE